jgi:phosphoglycolate phosphatase
MLNPVRRSIIFFDLDGTLAASMAHIEALIVSIAVEDLGLTQALIREHLPHLLSLPASEALPRLAALAGKDVGVLQEVVRRRDNARPPLTLFPDVSEVVERLANNGYTLVLTTNSPQDGLRERLEDAGIGRCFRLILGTDWGGGATKGPEHVRMAAAELGVTLDDIAGKAVLIGDQDGDMRLAREFGMLAIGRTNGPNSDKLRAAGAAYLIADLGELEAVLDAIEAEVD